MIQVPRLAAFYFDAPKRSLEVLTDDGFRPALERLMSLAMAAGVGKQSGVATKPNATPDGFLELVKLTSPVLLGLGFTHVTIGGDCFPSFTVDLNQLPTEGVW